MGAGLESRDREDAVVAAEVGKGHGGIVDHAAPERLHADEGHARVAGRAEQLIPGPFLDQVEGKLDRVEQAGADQLEGHLQVMGGDPHVPDLAGGLGGHGRFQRARRARDLGPVLFLGDLVQLVEVQVIGAQLPEAVLHVAGYALGAPQQALGGDDHLVADAGKGDPHLLFAVAIGVGRVEEGDPPVEGVPEDPDRFVLGQADNGDAAETAFRNGQVGGAERQVFHLVTSN